MSLVYKPKMPPLKNVGPEMLIYVYSPTCPACIMRGPLFDEEAKGLDNIYSLNGRGSTKFFDETGVQVQYFPSLYGITKRGLVVLIDGNPKHKELKNILLALEQT